MKGHIGRMHKLFNAAAQLFRRFGAPGLALFLAFAQPAAAQEPPTILALGDSLTAGYGLAEPDIFPVRLEAALKDAGTPASVINAGVSGDTTAGGLARLDWLIADKAPDVLLIELGGNDGLRAIDPKSTRTNVEAIIAKGKAAGSVILLTGMLAPPNLGREYEQEFNAIFPDLAAKHDVLFYPFFLEGVAADRALNQPDGIHPNRKGVDIIVARLLPLVQQALAKAKAGS